MKIEKYFHKLQRKYQKIFISREYIVIDEMLIPWHERLLQTIYIK